MSQPARSTFDTRDSSTLFLGDPNGEVVSVDVQSNLKIAGMKVRFGWIVEIRDSRSSKDDVANSGSIARPALKQVAQMDCAQLIFIGSRDAFVSHGDQSGLLREMLEYGADRRRGGDK